MKDYKSILGKQMKFQNSNSIAFIAAADEKGITVKCLETGEDVKCLNRDTFKNSILEGTYEEHEEYLFKSAESGVWPTFTQTQEYFGVKPKYDDGFTRFFCGVGDCAHK
jgi:hypothetical protein